MQFFVGIDVSLESSSICVIDERGVIIKEGTAPSEPEAIGRFIRHQGRKVEHVGLETGSLSQWLHAGLVRQGFRVSVMEARHVHAAFGAMRVKTDRNDARGLAQLVDRGGRAAVELAPQAGDLGEQRSFRRRRDAGIAPFTVMSWFSGTRQARARFAAVSCPTITAPVRLAIGPASSAWSECPCVMRM